MILEPPDFSSSHASSDPKLLDLLFKKNFKDLNCSFSHAVAFTLILPNHVSSAEHKVKSPVT